MVSKKDSNYNPENKEWYIISAEWLKDWKMFVNNKRSTTAYGARKSTKKDVGILDPGPISNGILLDEDRNPLPNQSKGKHYRGVNRSVWHQLYDTYGGGPILRRNELSIYAEEYKRPEEDDTEISKTAINKYFNASPADEESQPIVGDEFEDTSPTISKMMSSKRTGLLEKKRSVEVSIENKISRMKTSHIESRHHKDDKKVGSIPRRNLFKKRFID